MRNQWVRNILWVKEVDIKNRTYYFFDDMINFKNLDPKNIKVNEKIYKNILIYCTGYVQPNSVRPLYIIISNVNGLILKKIMKINI